MEGLARQGTAGGEQFRGCAVACEASSGAVGVSEVQLHARRLNVQRSHYARGDSRGVWPQYVEEHSWPVPCRVSSRQGRWRVVCAGVMRRLPLISLCGRGRRDEKKELHWEREATASEH